MTTDVQRAIEVSKHVSLRDIMLRRAQIETDFDALTDVPDLALAPKYRASYELREGDDDRVFVTVDFDITATSEPAGRASLSASFLAIYELAEARTFAEDALQHFASINGVYNLWPYWRELVHTAFNRVGLGSVVLPVFRVQAKTIDDPPPADTEAATPPAAAQDKG